MLTQINKKELQEIEEKIEDVFCDMGKAVALLSVMSNIDCTEQNASILVTDTSIMAGMAKEMIEEYMARMEGISQKVNHHLKGR
jgi:hypothetical protein